MEDVEIDVLGSEVVGSEDLLDQRRNGADGEIDQCGTIHVKLAGPAMAMAWLNSALFIAGAALVDDQRVGAFSIRAKTVRGERGSVAGFDERRGGGVAEDGSQATVGRVNVLGIGFGRDEQNAFNRAG